MATRASFDSGARPRLVWMITPLALITGRKVGRRRRSARARIDSTSASVGGHCWPAAMVCRASPNCWRTSSVTVASGMREARGRSRLWARRRLTLGRSRKELAMSLQCRPLVARRYTLRGFIGNLTTRSESYCEILYNRTFCSLDHGVCLTYYWLTVEGG